MYKSRKTEKDYELRLASLFFNAHNTERLTSLFDMRNLLVKLTTEVI